MHFTLNEPEKSNVDANRNRHDNLLAKMLFKVLILGSYGGSLSTVLGLGIGITDRDFEIRPDIRSGFNNCQSKEGHSLQQRAW